MKRIISAFIVAPGFFPLGMALFSPNDMAVGGAMAFAMIMYPIAILVGVPALLFYKSWQLDEWWHFTIGAATIGFLPSLFFFHIQPSMDWFGMVGGFMGIGAITGFVFWVVAYWKSNKAIESDA